MHGRATFQKVLREKQKKAARNALNSSTPSTLNPDVVVVVGLWVFEEDENGDLQIRHSETGKIFTISKE